jgi:hypothetical protein
MRRAARVDGNQAVIVAGLRQIPGVTVRDTSALGGGWPDLAIGCNGRTILMEIKNPAKVPSARKLTAAQQNFVTNWTGSPIWVVESLEKALESVPREARS